VFTARYELSPYIKQITLRVKSVNPDDHNLTRTLYHKATLPLSSAAYVMNSMTFIVCTYMTHVSFVCRNNSDTEAWNTFVIFV
jgi:hypothetical protein